MTKKGQRKISDADWNQLITLASGYLSLENGDIQASMARALAAHVDLISALKAEQISADIPGGRVTMFVPIEGGVALRIAGPSDEAPPPPPLPLPDEPTRPLENNPTFVLDED